MKEEGKPCFSTEKVKNSQIQPGKQPFFKKPLPSIPLLVHQSDKKQY